MAVCSEIHTKHINTVCVCARACVCLSASGRLCVKLNQTVHTARTYGLHAFLRPAVDEDQCLRCLASRSCYIAEAVCVPVQMWVCHTLPFSDTEAPCCTDSLCPIIFAIIVLSFVTFGPHKPWRMCRFLSVETSAVIYRTPQIKIQKKRSFHSQLPTPQCLQLDKYWEFSCFCREVDKNCVLMGFNLELW